MNLIPDMPPDPPTDHGDNVVLLPMAGAERDVLELLQWTRPKGREPSPKANAWNFGTILRNDSRQRGRRRFNEMREQEEILDDAWRPIRDVDDIDLCRWMAATYRLDFGVKTASEQVMSVANETRVHPVREYLSTTTWDGVGRLDKMLADHFGAEDTPLHAAVGTAWMTSLVARAMDPGCKVDTVPILVGRQGTRKSSTLRAMMPDVSWFSDSDIPLHHAQDQYQVIRGKWLYELAEFDRFSTKAEASKIKAYVTAQIDSYRDSYGHRVADHARQVGFVGTTNASEFFIDPTGSRRFWPIKTGDCDCVTMAAARDQLWAEAAHRYQSGAGWLLSQSDTLLVAEVADEFRVSDAWEGPVAEYLAPKTDAVIAEVLDRALEIKPRDQDKVASMRVAAILIRLGWTRTQKRGPPRGKGARMWMPPSSP